MDIDGWLRFFAAVLVIALILKSFFRACEFAVIEANEAKVKALAEKDDRYLKLQRLTEKESWLKNSFAVGRIGLDLLMGFSVFFLAEYLLGWRLQWKSFGLLFLISVGVTIVVSGIAEIVPRKLTKNSEKFAAAVVLPVKIYTAFLYPFALAAYAIAAVVCRLFGGSAKAKNEAVTEEDIRHLVDTGNETGVIEESQCEMINNIFEFGDVDVSDVMTHRKDIVAIDINSKIGDIVYLAINEGYSRIPVYENTVDKIIGMIYVKDLLCLVGCEHSEDFTIRQFMRKAVYLPETCMCNDAFETLTKQKCQCAIVVDEYGGTAGLVSLEDILEEIVGNIQDEYDDEKAEIVRIDEDVYTISGDTRPEDAEEQLGFVMPEDHNYDTMSAFIVDLLGRIPEQDEDPSVIYDNIEFTVLLTEDNWISKIKAKKLEITNEETEA